MSWQELRDYAFAREIDLYDRVKNLEKMQQGYRDEASALRVENDRLRSLVRCLLDNDPNDDAADGVTVLEVWRREARQLIT